MKYYDLRDVPTSKTVTDSWNWEWMYRHGVWGYRAGGGRWRAISATDPEHIGACISFGPFQEVTL